MIRVPCIVKAHRWVLMSGERVIVNKHAIQFTSVCANCGAAKRHAMPSIHAMTSREGSFMYDQLTPEEAVLSAWMNVGESLEFHAKAREQIAKANPTLARALDRLAQEGLHSRRVRGKRKK